MPRLSIIIPVHNDGEILRDTLRDLNQYVKGLMLSPCVFIFIENGSQDDSAAILEDLIKTNENQENTTLLGESIPNAGIGYAYQRGIDIALNNFGTNDHWIMLTASDLPFGSSDLNEFIMALKSESKSNFFIGSKANPKSQVERGFKRWLAGKVFYLLRRLLLGMKTGDPQGVFFVKSEVLSNLAPKVLSRNFFYTTELTYFAEKNSQSVVELPVVYQGERRASSVRVFKHGMELIKNIWDLKKRRVLI